MYGLLRKAGRFAISSRSYGSSVSMSRLSKSISSKSHQRLSESANRLSKSTNRLFCNQPVLSLDEPFFHGTTIEGSLTERESTLYQVCLYISQNLKNSKTRL